MNTPTNTSSQHGRPTGNAVSPFKANQIRPEWGDVKAVHAVFGTGKSVAYRLAQENKIRSSSLRERNKLRGKRLFNFDSIAAYIERMATGREEAAP